MSIKINSENFQVQVIRLYESWLENQELWGNSNTLCFCLGRITDEYPFERQLNSNLFTWLIGYQFTETLILFQKNPKIVHFIASRKKVELLKEISLRDHPFEIRLVEKTSDFTSLFDIIKESGTLGMILEDERYQFGEYISSYFLRLHEHVKNNEFQLQEVSGAVRLLQAVKSDFEKELLTKSGRFTTIILRNSLRKEIERVIISKEEVTHSIIVENCEKVIENPSKIGLSKISPNDVSDFGSMRVMSGDEIDFRSTENDAKLLNSSTINVCFGTEYKLYGTVTARTYMIDSSKYEETDYKFLTYLYKIAVSKLKPGTRMCDLYNTVKQTIQMKRSRLSEFFFADNIGFSTGLEKTFTINEHNTQVFLEGMVIVLRLIFQNIPEREERYLGIPGRSKYSLIIANTLLLDTTKVKLLTGGDTKFENVTYSLNERTFSVGDFANEKNKDGRGRTKKEVARKIALEQRRQKLQNEIFEKNRQRGKKEKTKVIEKLRQNVEQERLVCTEGPFPKLRDINMRTIVNSTDQKIIGVLEAHENGFRFVSPGPTIEIIYKNIKRTFFQPSKDESIVIIHFHLKTPILLGDQQAHSDLQFYSHIMEDFDGLFGLHRQQNDKEVAIESKRENELRSALNRVYYQFLKQVQEKAKIVVDIPFRDLEFDGTPHTQRIRLVPTTSFLVHLTHSPFFILPLDDVEIAVFERVMFGLRTFDLVFILKDYSKQISITSIPKGKLEMLQDWLTKIEIKYFKCRMNLRWDRILIQIRNCDWDPWDPDTGWKSFSGEDEKSSDDEDSEDYVPPEVDEDSEEYNEEEHEDDASPSWGELFKEAEAEDKKRGVSVVNVRRIEQEENVVEKLVRLEKKVLVAKNVVEEKNMRIEKLEKSVKVLCKRLGVSEDEFL